MLRLARALARETGQKNLCLAGGVALNCVANGKMLRDGTFDEIWIQPAAGDAGGALGAALATYYLATGAARAERRQATRCAARISGRPSPTTTSRRGSKRSARGSTFVERRRAGAGDRARRSRRARRSAGSRGAWSSARARSAPARSSAIARSPTMQKMLNLKVKFRESFRPFAPAVLREHVADWFELDRDSPYMLLVADVRARAPPRNDRRTSRSSGASISSTCRARTSRR